MPVILDCVSKSFGDNRILDAFSLTLPDCGTVAIMGASGCGKTTLLRLLAGLERPDGGKIRIPDGWIASMVFQEDRLIPTLNARGNVEIVTASDTRLADAVLECCALDADACRLFPDELSGGMRRRVALARAVAFGAELLLLDEAFKGLDANTRERVLEFVFNRADGANLPPRHKLAVMVTHDPDEALYAAERVVILDGAPLRVRADIKIPPQARRNADNANILAQIRHIITQSLRVESANEHEAVRP